MRKSFKRILNTVVTFSVVVVLMIGNATSVAAYTDVNGYPFVMKNFEFNLHKQTGKVYSQTGTLNDDNSYTFLNNGSYTVYEDIMQLRFGSSSENYFFPFDPEHYDYYLVGTYAAKFSELSDFNFDPTGASFIYYDGSSGDGYSLILFDSVEFYDYTNFQYKGHSFVCKFPDDFNTGIGKLIINATNGTISNDQVFSASIVPIPKAGTEEDALNSILQTLLKIDQDLLTSIENQERILTFLKTFRSNVVSHFENLVTSLQGWHNEMTEDLETWFYMIEERMSAGFTALYHQMTKEQDEKLNGYEGTSTPDANEEFNAGSSELVEVEEQLTDVSNDNINNYTDTAFDASIISNLGNGLVFVVTWFTNFWNMGGLFTALLNVCLAVNVAFFILRIKGK